MRALPLILIPLALLAGRPGVAADRDTTAGRPVLIRPARLGPYLGKPAPGDTPRVFAPGIVSLTGSGDYACTWSPDGREFYFTRTTRDTGGVKQVIMTSRLERGGWTVPLPVTFRRSQRPRTPRHGRRPARLLGLVPASAGGRACHPPPLRHLRRRPRAAGMVGGEVRRLGDVRQLDARRRRLRHREHLPGRQRHRLPDEATLRDGRFVGHQRITGAVDVLRPRFQKLAHPCIAPDGSYLVFDVEGGSHLFVTFRGGDGSWGAPVDLSEHGLARRRHREHLPRRQVPVLRPGR